MLRCLVGLKCVPTRTVKRALFTPKLKNPLVYRAFVPRETPFPPRTKWALGAIVFPGIRLPMLQLLVRFQSTPAVASEWALLAVELGRLLVVDALMALGARLPVGAEWALRAAIADGGRGPVVMLFRSVELQRVPVVALVLATLAVEAKFGIVVGAVVVGEVAFRVCPEWALVACEGAR